MLNGQNGSCSPMYVRPSSAFCVGPARGTSWRNGSGGQGHPAPEEHLAIRDRIFMNRNGACVAPRTCWSVQHNKVRIVLFKFRTSHGVLTNKAPTNVDERLVCGTGCISAGPKFREAGPSAKVGLRARGARRCPRPALEKRTLTLEGTTGGPKEWGS